MRISDCSSDVCSSDLGNMMNKSSSIRFAPNAFSQASRMAIILSGAFGLAAGAAAEAATPPQPAGAADTEGLGEIVVTATRRSALIRDVPISISAVSQVQLERSGASEATDIVKMVPGLAFTENSSGQAVLAVRGVQSTAVFGNLQQTVALYHDDVPVLDLVIPWTVPRLQLFDVERVEVLDRKSVV